MAFTKMDIPISTYCKIQQKKNESWGCFGWAGVWFVREGKGRGVGLGGESEWERREGRLMFCCTCQLVGIYNFHLSCKYMIKKNCINIWVLQIHHSRQQNSWTMIYRILCTQLLMISSFVKALVFNSTHVPILDVSLSYYLNNMFTRVFSIWTLS